MNSLNFLRRLLICPILGLLITVEVLAIDPNFVSDHSKQSEALVRPEVEKLFSQLTTSLPMSNFINFSKGKIYISGGRLIWRNLAGLEKVLVSSEGHPAGHSLSGFEISPDGSKVAYYTTEGGQDLKSWNAITISSTPKVLLPEAAINRMEGFSWSLDSQGFYYSFWNDKEKVQNKELPIIEVRYKSLLNGQDQVVFAPGYAENFGITEVDQGRTLISYRLLALNSGIKTTFSMFKATKNKNGRLGNWQLVYPRNKYVGVYVGIYENKALVLTSRAGDTYGIEAIDVLDNLTDAGQTGNKAETLVSSDPKRVLHMAELINDTLVLQYHTVDTQEVSVKILNLKDKTEIVTKIKDLGLTAFGDLGRFKFGPKSQVARAVYADVMNGDHVLEIDLKTSSLKKLQNLKPLDFNSEDFKYEHTSFIAEDGTEITGKLFTPKNKKPKFVFIRYYGWISIKNAPESKEVQAVLKAGGAYFVADMPGGGEKGAEWFIKGSRQRHKMVKYISEASSFLQKKLNLSAEEVVAMGRSWGGLTSFLLARYYGSNFGVIAPVVPVLDIEDIFKNAWFGRIAHSDLAPFIDEEGNYILDDAFWNYVESLNPLRILDSLSTTVKIFLLTNGADDRVDQGGAQEAEFAEKLLNRIGKDNFLYHRSKAGNHGTRYYQILLLSYLAQKYNSDLLTEASANSCSAYLKR